MCLCEVLGVGAVGHQATEQRRIGRARAEAVHADPLRRVLRGHGARDLEHGRLCGRVRRQARRPDERRRRPVRDDAARPLLQHPRQRRAEAEERPASAHREYPVEVGGGHLVRRPDVVDPRGKDEPVETSERGARLFDYACSVILIGDVAAD